MHRNHRLFFLLGLLLLFAGFFAYLFYITKYRPLPPKPPVADYRIPAADSTSYNHVFFYDFENFKQTDLLSTTKSLSGKYALKVKGKKEYSLLVQKPLSELSWQGFSEARVSAWIQTNSVNLLSGKLMFQIVDKANTLKYSYSVNLEDVTPANGQWFYISGKAVISDYKPEPTDIIKVYYWNHCPGEVFMDDVLIVIGSQQIKGTKPMLDETVENYKFIALPNQPPYPGIYAKKILAVNLKNTTIQSVDGKGSLEMESHDEFLTGHFIQGVKTDQLLLVRHHLPFAIIWYVLDKMEFKFRTIDPILFPVVPAMATMIAADINGDGMDELIFKSGNTDYLRVFDFNKSPQMAEIHSQDNPDFGKQKNQICRFRVKDSKKESLVLIDVNGKTFLLGFENNRFDIKSMGDLSEAAAENFDCQVVSGHFVKESNNDNLLVLYREKKTQKCFYKLMDIDPLTGTKTCLQQGSFDNKCDTLYPENTYFAGDMDGDGIDELLSYGHSWRFDMKLIRFTEKNYQIMGNIDFDGYESDHNPKYYENLTVAAGNFADSKTFSIFTVCKNHQPIPDLPETIGIYSLQIKDKEVAK